MVGVVSMKRDIPEKFWNDWLKADEDERIKLVQKTMIARELAEHLALKFSKTKMQRKFIKEMAARNINDYFQDLEQFMISKKLTPLYLAESLAKKSKLTKKDVEDFSKKIKAAAAKRFLDEHPSHISKKEMAQAKKLALASKKDNLCGSEKELFRKLRRK
jgi:hypothetical protein